MPPFRSSRSARVAETADEVLQRLHRDPAAGAHPDRFYGSLGQKLIELGPTDREELGGFLWSNQQLGERVSARSLARGQIDHVGVVHGGFSCQRERPGGVPAAVLCEVHPVDVRHGGVVQRNRSRRFHDHRHDGVSGQTRPPSLGTSDGSVCLGLWRLRNDCMKVAVKARFTAGERRDRLSRRVSLVRFARPT